MRIVRFSLSTSCALILLVTFALPQIRAAVSSQSTLILTDYDKAQIVRSVLYTELTKRKWLEAQTVLLLNDENIKPEWLPAIPNVKFELLDKDKIQFGVATDKVISYYFIGRLEIKGQKVRVSFGQHEEGKRSSSGSGTIYEYRRASGRWRGKPVEGFGYCAAPGQNSE